MTRRAFWRTAMGSLLMTVASLLPTATSASAAPDAVTVQYELTDRCQISSGCYIVVEGEDGWMAYGSRAMRVQWNDGHIEWFVVGLDRAVWHLIQSFDDWKSMGGRNVADMGRADMSGGHPTISVWLTDGDVWCSRWQNSKWNWFNC